MLLVWFFYKYGARYGLDLSHSGQGPVASFCKHENKPAGSTLGGEILDPQLPSAVTISFSKNSLTLWSKLVYNVVKETVPQRYA
jgi:hypothetical protein